MVGVVGSNPIEPTNEQNEGVRQRELPTGNPARQTYKRHAATSRGVFLFAAETTHAAPMRCTFSERHRTSSDHPARTSTATARRAESSANRPREQAAHAAHVSNAIHQNDKRAVRATERAHDHVRGYDHRNARARLRNARDSQHRGRDEVTKPQKGGRRCRFRHPPYRDPQCRCFNLSGLRTT